MSEQKLSYMQVLDQWTDDQVVGPLWDNFPGNEDDPEAQENFSQAVEGVKKTIREKVLESFRNGQKTGPYKQPARPQKQTAT